MTDNGIETLEAPAINGDRDPITAAEPKATVIARDDTLTGKLQVRGSGQVLGSFNGEIDSDGDLVIGSEAHVEANIRGVRVTIAGFVRGNVVAASRLKITSTGRLEGDAKVGALVVQEGGVHHGVIRVHPEGLPEGDAHAASEPAARPGLVTLRTAPNAIGRVRKFWGEFF